ncbi:MAG: hypothetical protein IPM77_01120 [Crocinitomicaceae bacterium]|nr:hypothetical protein [Crocinitomicaceae bacterium]
MNFTNFSVAIITIFSFYAANSQTAWTWTELDTMPFPITNNAVAFGTNSGNPFVYSFGGIDTTKIYSGINNNAYRYDVNLDIWTQISSVPVALPLIASSASSVKNKIYIIGGYHVYSNGSETSSNEVIVFNPETNLYESNGTNIPVPIDDQTQCVWRDSLIYVITGWSNTTNVNNVQIYDPAMDTWTPGTSVPNLSAYKVFGSSGYIIGDTIYYFGGATTGFNFPAQKKLRKGIIDPLNPEQISWTLEEDAPENNYRSACLAHGNNIFWIGGSSVSYNYNGIAYNGSGGVEPLFQITRYNAGSKNWYEGTGAPYGQMDLRGAAQTSSESWIICGGMESGQQVSNRTFLLTYDPLTGNIPEPDFYNFHIAESKVIFNQTPVKIEIYSMDGKMLSEIDIHDPVIPTNLKGFFIIKCVWNDYSKSMKLFID